ncbi:IS701 family transposase [Streptomyces sp. NPDC001889]
MRTVSPQLTADVPPLWSLPPVSRGPEAGPAGGDPEAVLRDLCAPLFQSLRRSDQRRRGAEYIRGLLSTRGRKSIRNMAALIGGSGTGQSLHHFICSSTWDWTLVRRAMAEYVIRTSPPRAWVARPMTIPKVGQHSVGVSRYFSPDEGQALNAQRAIGVWAVSDRMSVPLNWRLHLPGTWIKDGLRRNQASIPCEIQPETLSDCALMACREMLAGGWGLPARPVVVDIGEADPLATVAGLHADGIPSLVRVTGELPLSVTDAALTGHGSHPLPAADIMRAARNMRRPVVWREEGPRPRRRTSLVTAVRVAAPGTARPGSGAAGTDRDGGLLLVGVGETSRQWPAELWLTDLPASQAAAVPQLGSLSHRVEQVFDEVTAQVGIRDYVGRSYSGWHRHVTLASAAHAVAVLSAAAGARPPVRAARAVRAS